MNLMLHQFYSVMILVTLLVLNSCSSPETKKELPQLGKNPISEVIAAMTLDEKVRMVVGKYKPSPLPADYDSVANQQKVQGAAGDGFSIPRLGIPSIIYADGPAGLRIDAQRKNDSSSTYHATAFPVATLLASTWDTALVEKVGKAMGLEVLEYGVDILLAPGMNIHRNPLTGRNFEYYSEDPLIAGNMAASLVKGVQSNGVGTSVKHFAANNQESNRAGVDVIVSERALREIYLKGFEIAIKKGQPWTVMSSYNKINGAYTSESYDLLTTMLRDEWKYKGFVMTDWGGGKDAIVQMKSGNDLLMPGTEAQIKSITEAVKKGDLDSNILNRNVERILNIIAQSPCFKKYAYSNKPPLKDHAIVSHQAATEGTILLKNEKGSLPLSGSGQKIAAFGNRSFDILPGGQGSGYVNYAYKISLQEGLEKAGFIVNKDMEKLYNTFIAGEKAKYPPENFWVAPIIPEMALDAAIITNMSNQADLALLTIGRNSGEGDDRKLEGDYYLTKEEKNTIDLISKAFHSKGKKVIVILNIGGVIEMASWRDKADAIVLAWQPGQEAGNAIADILTGKINPSGKLATTFPMDYKDVPSAKNFPGLPKEKPETVKYEEGIYVGYRHYATKKIKTAYEFGYGLSYTDFSYGNLELNATTFKDKIIATIAVTNTGKVAGKEVVQLYLSAPSLKLDKPKIELKGFAKTGLLAPGASQTISFIIPASDLASFDTSSSSWLAEKGKYTASIGSSSLNIKQSMDFQLPEEIVVSKLNKALAPK
jgi:beta-glucosidase